ncbi:4-coumarate--CoA ligase 1-like [Venturia canescens]|uniref:4-coumarate--CoA ligase 1-like n=1 Tax=Venturia canescens TaxID=32260 RepID=UPI001C9C4E24|nr:4-coumarate--CoA ligase 1-like [Venturia canescens]
MFPRAFICQVYGSTEAGGIIVAQKRNSKIGSIGRLTGNTQLKVIDPETGRILNPNETGEACFKNTYVMKGYYRNPEATRETIDTEDWLHSGDLLYYDEEGNLFFVDRLKELIKFRGNHVSPTMIEHVLLQHAAIEEAAVVSIMHEADGEHPIAFVETKSGFQVSLLFFLVHFSNEFADLLSIFTLFANYTLHPNNIFIHVNNSILLYFSVNFRGRNSNNCH